MRVEQALAPPFARGRARWLRHVGSRCPAHLHGGSRATPVSGLFLDRPSVTPDRAGRLRSSAVANRAAATPAPEQCSRTRVFHIFGNSMVAHGDFLGRGATNELLPSFA